MISKDLLSEVLELNQVDNIYIEDEDLYFCDLNRGINIYELAYKCKIWASKQNIGIDSSIGVCGDKSLIFSCSLYMDKTGCASEYFESDTESESIFKACQWILDNKTIN